MALSGVMSGGAHRGEVEEERELLVTIARFERVASWARLGGSVSILKGFCGNVLQWLARPCGSHGGRMERGAAIPPVRVQDTALRHALDTARRNETSGGGRARTTSIEWFGCRSGIAPDGRAPLAIRCVLSVVWDFLLKLCFTHFTHCAQPLRAPNPTQAAFSQRDREPQQICVRWCAECVVRLSYYDEHPMTRRRRGGPLVFASAVCLVSRAACSFFVKGELVCLSELQECHEECLRTCQFDEYRNTPLPVSLCRDTNTNPAP